MLAERNILYFTPFYFRNGKTNPKNKYFVVLKNMEDKVILASLPTSKNTVPRYMGELVQGCIEAPDINFNCFVFLKDVEVTEDNQSFPRTTFIYGHQLDTHEAEKMEMDYQIEDIDYEVLGKMKQPLFDELIDCLRTSATVKRKYKRMLSK